MNQGGNLNRMVYRNFRINDEIAKIKLQEAKADATKYEYQFSVIIPVYNAEEYVERAINSALSQENISLQVIVINDGSTDRSGEICESFLKHINYVYFCQNNMGQSAARNKGLKESNGKYIFFLDADDFLTDNCLQHTYERMENSNLDVLGIDSVEENGNGHVIKMPVPLVINDGEVISGEKYMKRFGFHVSVTPWQYVFRRSFLIGGNFLFRTGYFHEDCEFTAHYFPYARRVSYINKTVYVHDVTSISTMRSKNIKKSLDLIEISIWIYRDAEVAKRFFCEKIVNELIQYAASEAFGSIVSCVHNGFSLKEYLSDKMRRNRIAALIRPGKKYKIIYVLLLLRQYMLISILVKVFSHRRK